MKQIPLRMAFILSLLSIIVPVQGTTAGEMEGEWLPVLGVRNGEPYPVGEVTITVKDDQYFAEFDGKVVSTGTLKLNTSAKPKQYDLTITGEAPDAGSTYYGIYTIAGNVMISTVNLQDGGERPTEFTSEPNSNQQFIVWKKIEAEENESE